MRRVRRTSWLRAGALMAMLALPACLPGADGSMTGAPETGAITVTALAPSGAPAAETNDDVSQTGPDIRADDSETAFTPAQADGASDTAVGVAPEHSRAAQPAAPADPALARARADCAAQGGRLVPTATGQGRLACLFDTGDAGKRCTARGQCEGECLARSGTCAPLRPLFGCHEVLNARGARVTECMQ